MSDRVDVEVEIAGSDGVPTLDVNAFRTFPDGSDFILDFVDVAEGDQAEVKVRVRVAKGFVPHLIDRCRDAGA